MHSSVHNRGESYRQASWDLADDAGPPPWVVAGPAGARTGSAAWSFGASRSCPFCRRTALYPTQFVGQSDRIMPVMALAVTRDWPVVGGLILAAPYAAAMSAVAGFLLLI